MKNEIVLLPHPNQLSLLRTAQKELCSLLHAFTAIPVLPLCVKCSGLHQFDDTITHAVPTGVFFDSDCVFLIIDLEINGKTTNGSIALCRLMSKTEMAEAERAKVRLIGEHLCASLKKISPSRVAQLETEETDVSITWSVVRSRWVKLRYA